MTDTSQTSQTSQTGDARTSDPKHADRSATTDDVKHKDIADAIRRDSTGTDETPPPTPTGDSKRGSAEAAAMD